MSSFKGVSHLALTVLSVSAKLSIGKISYSVQEFIGKGSQGTVVFKYVWHS